MTTPAEIHHVDDFIEDCTQNAYARFVLMLMRLSASLALSFAPFTKQFELYCSWQAKRYRVTGASRMGDIWLARDFKRENGYDFRVDAYTCSEWSPYADPNIKEKLPKFELELPEGDDRQAKVVFSQRTDEGWHLSISVDGHASDWQSGLELAATFMEKRAGELEATSSSPLSAALGRDYRDEAKSIRQLLGPAPSPVQPIPATWQPIATAPRDRTEILGWDEEIDGVRVLRWGGERIPGDRSGWILVPNSINYYTPSHWMPCPVGPTKTTPVEQSTPIKESLKESPNKSHYLSDAEIETLRRWAEFPNVFNPGMMSHRHLLERAARQLQESKSLIAASSKYHPSLGLHPHQNPMEKFALDLWLERNKQPNGGPPAILGYLLGRDNRALYPSDRDWLVANTVMQWLGSPVGQNFVRELAFAFGK